MSSKKKILITVASLLVVSAVSVALYTNISYKKKQNSSPKTTNNG